MTRAATGELRPDSPSSVQHIRHPDYVASLESEKHVFLAGNLKQPATYPFIREDRVEFIACSYQTGDDGLPHWHANVTEYELVLEGRLGYVEMETDREVWATAGDFLCVPAGTCVKRFVPGPTRTIAIKVPSSPEKHHCDACQRDCQNRIAPYSRPERQSP